MIATLSPKIILSQHNDTELLLWGKHVILCADHNCATQYHDIHEAVFLKTQYLWFLVKALLVIKKKGKVVN